ncbi:hypothetical protein [Streptomyces sp. NPDC048350]|uniref:hypothetical protein n=1 Tax=Streptomyces sp. NPDC048350 TaxID=3365538 RepID=UPI0037235139
MRTAYAAASRCGMLDTEIERPSPERTVKSYQGQKSVTRDYWAATSVRQLSSSRTWNGTTRC